MSSEHASLTIAGASFEVVTLSAREAISELFHVELHCKGGGDPRALAGAEARVTLADGFGAERTIAGVVAEAEEQTGDDGHAHLHVTVRPRAFRHTLGRGARVFNGVDVVDIVDRVLAERPRWELAATYAPHVHCVQYREDDWTFVSRLLEEEGIHHRFDHEDGDTTLVLADTSTIAPEIHGGAAIPFGLETGMTRSRESVVELGAHGAVAPSRFTVASFSPRNPRLAVNGGHGEGPLEIYEAPGGGTESPEECARQARFRGEAAACHAAGVTGAANSVRLVPGRIVEIVGHPGRLDGRYLVVEARAEIAQRRRGDAGAASSSYLCRFRLLPAAVPFRPRRATPPARQAGLQLGVVVGERGAEVHPDAAGRVRVQHHWDREGARDERAGTWMRVAQRGTASSMLLPRVGWNVATLNDEGEIDAPSVLSRLHDGEHPPSYPLPANKTRVVYKTATTPGGGSFNEVHFEDRRGGERMFWNASKDMAVLVKNDDAEQVVRNARRAVVRDEHVDLAVNHDIGVMGDRSVRVAQHETVTVSGASDKAVQGDERSVIGIMRHVTSGDAHATTVTGTRRVEVGVAQIDVTLGPISAQAKTISILVGGAMVRVTDKTLSDSAGWASVQTIGAAKIETVGQARSTSAKRALVETAGGAMVFHAAKDFTDKADKTSKLHAGAALAGHAPAIRIEAGKKLTLRVGATCITVLPTEIRVQSPAYNLAGKSKFVVLSPKVDHN
jgi:type VI secretion system secreted protein VgrG